MMYAACDIVTIKDLYVKYLTNVAGINFTQREIDVMACIVSGRSVKGTAALLSSGIKAIGHRSVETHLLNIRRKINASAKDNIINFVELSAQREIIHSYYQMLLADGEFSRVLEKLKEKIHSNIDAVQVVRFNKTDCYRGLTNRLIQELNYLGIQGVDIECDSILDCTKTNYMLAEDKNSIYILPSDQSEACSKFIDFYSDKDMQHVHIFLASSCDQIAGLKIIDISKCTYYSVFLDILALLSPEIIVHAKEFKRLMNNRYGDELQIGSIKVAVEENASLTRHFAKYSRFFFGGAAVFLLAFVLYRVTIPKLGMQHHGSDDVISTINSIAIVSAKNSTTNNITASTLAANHASVKQLESIWERFQSNGIEKYYMAKEVGDKELSNLVYCFCVLANYYNIHEHDGLKARVLLNKSNKLLKQYIMYRSKIPFDLNTLTPEQIYIEIKDFVGIREMYTLVQYLLGRTYTYQGSKQDGAKHFKISLVLGSKFGLFEGYLSRINLLKIQKNDIVSMIRAKNSNDVIINACNNAIEEYKALMYDNNTYKDSYRPSGEIFNLVVPANSTYNKLECLQEILSYYCILISVENDHARLKFYMNNIANTLQPTIDLFKQVEPKKVASVLCVIGYTILLLRDEGITFSNESGAYEALTSTVLEKLNKDAANTSCHITDKELALAAQIFTLADSISKQSHYTKAEANNGLQLVYERVLKAAKPDGDKYLIMDKIRHHRTIRDKINDQLKRKSSDPIDFLVR